MVDCALFLLSYREATEWSCARKVIFNILDSPPTGLFTCEEIGMRLIMIVVVGSIVPYLLNGLQVSPLLENRNAPERRYRMVQCGSLFTLVGAVTQVSSLLTHSTHCPIFPLTDCGSGECIELYKIKAHALFAGSVVATAGCYMVSAGWNNISQRARNLIAAARRLPNCVGGMAKKFGRVCLYNGVPLMVTGLSWRGVKHFDVLAKEQSSCNDNSSDASRIIEKEALLLQGVFISGAMLTLVGVGSYSLGICLKRERATIAPIAQQELDLF